MDAITSSENEILEGWGKVFKTFYEEKKEK